MSSVKSIRDGALGFSSNMGMFTMQYRRMELGFKRELSVIQKLPNN